MCSSIISGILDQMESGAFPVPYFFSAVNCGGGVWPITSSQLTLSQYDTPITALEICPSANKAACPVPMVLSMVLPPNLKITFFGNDENGNVSVLNRIKEPGQTNIYSNDYHTNAQIADTVTGSPLTWYSKNCNGEKNGCHTNTIPDNCDTKVTSAFDQDADCVINPNTCDKSKNKLLKSMISCNSPLWPSFFGINTFEYTSNTPDASWSTCQLLPAQPGGNLNPYPHRGQDYCVQNGKATIEKAAYATVWTADSSQNCALQQGFFQACACIGQEAEALDSNFSKSYDPSPETGTCGPNFCGNCHYATFGLELPCICTDNSGSLRGSAQQIQIGLVDNNNKSISWEDLQILWCYKGVSLAGIPISLYQSGTPKCDQIMIQACSNTAQLTISPELDTQCQCIIEQKTFEAAFASIGIPSTCFSTICNISNDQVYKTKQQLINCSARLCEQTLSVHGNSIFVTGVQEIICNGQVYDVSSVVQTSAVVPLVSQVVAPYGAFTVGATFYIVLAVLLMLVIVCILWGVRAMRQRSRDKKIAQEEFEAALNKT